MFLLIVQGVILVSALCNDGKRDYDWSLSRMASRTTGHLCNMTLPPFIRVAVYKAFGALYGVNFDELPAGTNLNDFRSFNAFFTRAIDLRKRPIDAADDVNTLCSPVDGRILSFGPIDSSCSMVSCVKGADYPLEEFLLGFSSGKQDSELDRLYKCASSRLLDEAVSDAEKRGNQICYCVIYLAPQDYHRFHSPAHFSVYYSRHIAGYLEPVKPSYLERHRHVLKSNERVNLLGQWKHGLFAYSAIGALNVGSIVMNFDQQIKSNQQGPRSPYLRD